MALRNNFALTKMFLITKFDCISTINIMVIPSGIGFIFRSRQGLPPKSAGVLIVRVLCFLPGLAFLGHLQYEVHFDHGFHTQSTKIHLEKKNIIMMWHWILCPIRQLIFFLWSKISKKVFKVENQGILISNQKMLPSDQSKICFEFKNN